MTSRFGSVNQKPQLGAAAFVISHDLELEADPLSLILIPEAWKRFPAFANPAQ